MVVPLQQADGVIWIEQLASGSLVGVSDFWHRGTVGKSHPQIAAMAKHRCNAHVSNAKTHDAINMLISSASP